MKPLRKKYRIMVQEQEAVTVDAHRCFHCSASIIRKVVEELRRHLPSERIEVRYRKNVVATVGKNGVMAWRASP